MNSTQRKLDEAKFFLEKMKTHEPYFDYYLSAFLNASRSTTWVMRHEFLEVDGWEAWFRSCAITEEEKKNMSQINDLRIESAKKSGVKTKFHFLDYVVPDEEYYPIISRALDELEGEDVEISVYEESDEIPNDDSMFIIRGKVEPSGSDDATSREHVYALCHAYYEFLARHVSVCTERFNEPRSGIK